jgi:hypothetical protein
MNGFGFIEYEDAMDARDVVPGKSSSPPDYHREADHFPIAFREYHYSTYRLLSI